MMTAKSKPILLDGGMGQELVNRGGKGAYGEWAVAALYENPDMVRAIHRDYIHAGADIITTNTYSATRTRLDHVAMENRFAELVRAAGSLLFRHVQPVADTFGLRPVCRRLKPVMWLNLRFPLPRWSRSIAS